MTELSSSAPCLRGELGPQATERVDAGASTRGGYVSTLGCLSTLLALLCLLSLASPQKQSPPGNRQADDYTISVNVDMVVLSATAEDHKGALVSGLGKKDFHIYEDGILQEIKYFSHEDVPVTVGLVVDNSGSMGPKRSDVVAAALAFARSSNPQDQMFVVNFNERVSFGLPLHTPFTDQAPELERALSGIAASGQTALYDAVSAALEHLKKGNRDKKVLIVVSDGGDNASKHKLADIIALAGQPDAIVYTVGIFDQQDADRNPGVLRRIARDTGGEAFFPESLKDIVPTCEQIAHDIRNQYTLAYVPTNRKRDGTYRVIQVKTRGGVRVRTRTGYFAPQMIPASTVKVVSP